jgi:hypothetical protein
MNKREVLLMKALTVVLFINILIFSLCACVRNQDTTGPTGPAYATGNPIDSSYQQQVLEQNENTMRTEAAEMDAVRGGHIGGRR